MAFETFTTKAAGVQKAELLLHQIRQIYRTAKATQAILTDYQAGTDAALIAAANALLTTAERTEIAAMVAQLTTLTADWEANHAAAVGI